MTAALEGGKWSAARPVRTLPPGKTPYPFYWKLGGPQGRSGRAEKLVPTGIRSRTVQPVVIRYTDWATRPTLIYIYIYIYIYCSTSLSINLTGLLGREDGVLKSSWFTRQIYRTSSHGRSKDWQGQFATTLTQLRHNCFLTQSGDKSSSHFVAFFLYHKWGWYPDRKWIHGPWPPLFPPKWMRKKNSFHFLKLKKKDMEPLSYILLSLFCSSFPSEEHRNFSLKFDFSTNFTRRDF